MSDLATLPATEQARLIRTRQASPVEVTRAVIPGRSLQESVRICGSAMAGTSSQATGDSIRRFSFAFALRYSM